MLAGTCVVACGTAGEETGWVEAFEGALREGGGCAVAVGGLGEGGGGEEEEGEEDEEGEMGGEDGHFVFCFIGVGGVFFGDDDYGEWVEMLEWVELFMRWRGCVRDAFLSLCSSEDSILSMMKFLNQKLGACDTVLGQLQRLDNPRAEHSISRIM